VSWTSSTRQGEYLKQLVVSSGEPGKMAVGPAGELYVAIYEGGRETYAINEYNPVGELVAHNDGKSAGGFGALGAISGLALDAAGNLYVSDGATESVDEFDSSGRFDGKITGSGGQEATPQGRLFETRPAWRSTSRMATCMWPITCPVPGSANSQRWTSSGRRSWGATPFLESEGVAGVTPHERDAAGADRSHRGSHELLLRIRPPRRPADAPALKRASKKAKVSNG